MKKQFIFIGVCFLMMNSFSQIPNAGFENWISKGSYEEPEGWVTFNRDFAETGVLVCEKTTQHTEGQYAVKLISKYSSKIGGVYPSWLLSSTDSAIVDIIWGFPYTLRPKYFKWDMIYDHKGSDVGIVFIKFTRWDTTLKKQIVIAQNMMQLTTSYANWTHMQMRITWQYSDIPDTCAIGFACSDEETAVEGTSLTVDNLILDDVNDIQSIDENASLQLYPSFAKKYLTILPESQNIESCSIEIFNLQGSRVKQFTDIKLTKGNPVNINLDGLQEGLYVLKLSDGKIQFVKRFVKMAEN